MKMFRVFEMYLKDGNYIVFRKGNEMNLLKFISSKDNDILFH